MRPPWIVGLLSSFAALGVGCGDDGVGDAAVPDADTGPMTVEAVAPADPAMPDFECPEGFVLEAAGDDPPACLPWPGGSPDDCVAGALHLPGEEGCRPIGAACPAAGWPEDLPADGVLYVDAGGRGPGDGTVASPFRSIADALAVATAGDVVAIAAGEYAEELDVPPGVTVRGVCPTETSIATTSSPAVRLTGEGSVLRDVEVAGTGEIGVALEGATNATLSGVFVTAASRHALVVTGGSVTMSDVWIHDVGGERGRVVSFAGGAEGALSAVVIEDVEGLGFQLIEGASVDATQLVVRRCTVAPGSSLAGGVRLDSGATLDASRSVFTRNLTYGVKAADVEAVVRLRHCLLAENLPDEDLEGGTGVEATSGGRLEVSQSVIERNRRAGIRITRDGATGVITDVLIRDTRAQESNGEAGFGIEIQGALDTAAVVATISRVAVLRSRAAGVFSVVGAELTAEDLWVADVAGRQLEGVGGQGIALDFFDRATLSKVRIERARETGLWARRVAELTLSDVTVRAGRGRMVDGRLGDGIALSSATTTMQRILVDDVPRVGIWVGDRAEVVGEDTRIVATRAQDCAMGDCADLPFGMGLGIYQNAQVSFTRFVVEDSSLCGFQLATGGELDLAGGLVRANSIGACVQTEGFNLSRVSAQVRYMDNEQNLVASMLPTPDVPSGVTQVD